MDFVYGKITTAYIFLTFVTKCIYYPFFILFEHQIQTENYLSFLLYYMRKELFNTIIYAFYLHSKILIHFICNTYPYHVSSYIHLRKITIRIGFVQGKINLFVIEIMDKIDFLSKISDFQRKILSTRCENSKFDQLLSQFLKISPSRQELN
jgi:hypothetical protein